MVPDFLKDFFESQLETWHDCRNNYDYLINVKKKLISKSPYPLYAQCNPKRIVSTAANLDKNTLKERKCFLCCQNRPENQKSFDILKGYDLLVNPFPIFKYHFTIASKDHCLQKLSLSEMIELASLLPGMVVFYNGAKAGASAPDHLHFQAIPKEELPLVSHSENLIKENKVSPGINLISNPDSYFKYYYVLFNREKRQQLDEIYLSELSEKEFVKNCDQLNVLAWTDDNKRINLIFVPRKNHRPSCYYSDGPDRMLVSPGAIDMAGVVITPVEKDFNKIGEKEMTEIYRETAIS